MPEINLQSRNRTGWIEVITGPMFSGKTEELLRRIRRALLANQKVEIFKPAIDTRHSKEKIVSHDRNEIASISVENSAEIHDKCKDIQVVGIDEAQFLDEGLIDVCNQLANIGKRVVVAGLDMDFRGYPFETMPALMAIAEDLTKLSAICTECGSPAHFSHRLIKQDQKILLGEKDKYIPLCRKCFLDFNK